MDGNFEITFQIQEIPMQSVEEWANISIEDWQQMFGTVQVFDQEPVFEEFEETERDASLIQLINELNASSNHEFRQILEDNGRKAIFKFALDKFETVDNLFWFID